MKISASKKFLKVYRRLGSTQQGQIDAALIKYEADRADPALRDHALRGKMNGLRAFSAGFDLRVIYREEDGFITIILLDAGSHDQVY